MSSGTKYASSKQAQADRSRSGWPDERQPEHAGEEDRAVPDRELEVVQLLGVVFDPVRRPGPEQIDDHDRDELEQIQVHSRPARHVRHLGQDAETRARLCRLRRRGGNHGRERRTPGTPGTGGTLLTFLTERRGLEDERQASQNTLLGKCDALERHSQAARGWERSRTRSARSTFSATTSCRRLSVKSTIPSSLPSRIACASLMSSSLRISFLTVGFIRMISTSRHAGLARRGRPVLGRRQQFLGDDRLEVERQVLPHRRVHVLREKVEDTADRRRGGRGVDRAEDQVAGLGRVHGRVERFAVTHLAHQDDVGVLPDRVLERRVPVDDVDPHLALIDDALVVLECEFDRVFDRDDVTAARAC